MANSYLTRTLGTPTLATKYTLSFWIKRSKTSDRQQFFRTNGYMYFEFQSDDKLHYFDQGHNGDLITNRLFRDPNAWYHIVLAVDTTLGTADNRARIYVNGVEETSFASRTNPTQNNAGYAFKASSASYLGTNEGSNLYFDGYMSHAAGVDGQQLAPTVFGETDSTSGIWKFKSPSGVTWGTNGFHFKFENSGNLGLDSSSNTNNWTVNGNLKQAVDTPSNVYATFNSLDSYYQADTLSNGNLTMTGGGQYAPRTATLGLTTGKWYWEIQTNNFQASDGSAFGISSQMATASNYEYYNQSGANVGYGYFSNGSGYGNNGAIFTGYGTGSGTHIIGIALNLDDNKIAWSYDGAWQGSTDPSSGNTNMISITAPSSLTTGTYFPAFTQKDNSRVVNVNFGNGFFGTTAITSAGSNGNGSLFEYDCPTGYYALNTKNLNTYG